MSAQSPKSRKRANACIYCRQRKVRCTGNNPCKSCFDHGKNCIYFPPGRRKVKETRAQETVLLRQRLAEVEDILQASIAQQMISRPSDPTLRQQQQDLPSVELHPASDFGLADNIQTHNSRPLPACTSPSPIQQDQYHINQPRVFPPPLSLPKPCLTLYDQASDITTSNDSLHSFSDSQSLIDGTVIAKTAPSILIDEEESIVSPDNVNWEHHGPGSWLSVCSEPGIKWICERTGDLKFRDSAESLSASWTKRLKLQRPMASDRAPEPDAKTAWIYTKAYFDDCYYTIFGIVHRPAFEARLRTQFAQDPAFEDDPSWFALRNVVYASGCRIVFSRDASLAFTETQARAWPYFENAMSVTSNLIYTPTGLGAVQALALMAFYCEGLGSPALGYMICSNAVRLAQSKGLHRQPSKLWNLPDSEIIQRNWLFWAIYCCEKAIMNRSGRPSAIDDGDISCQIPTTKASGSTVDIDLFTHIIKHAQIASSISKTLTSVSAFRRTTNEMISVVQSLNQQLQDWKEHLPDSLEVDNLRVSHVLPTSSSKARAYYLHYAYYGSLIIVHSIFSYPWIAAIFGAESTEAFKDQVSISTKIIEDASRNVIITTRALAIDATSPTWLAFHYPMIGIINLFISLLKSPKTSTAESDVILMDMAAGHFAHLQFITSSELAYSFPREVAELARITVKRAAVQNSADMSSIDSSYSNVWIDMDPNIWGNMDALSAIDIDLDIWNVFSTVSTYEVPGANHTSQMSGETHE